MGHFVYELCRTLFIVFVVLKISPHAKMINVVVWWRREIKSMSDSYQHLFVASNF
jgi:hypothetical protein